MAARVRLALLELGQWYGPYGSSGQWVCQGTTSESAVSEKGVRVRACSLIVSDQWLSDSLALQAPKQFDTYLPKTEPVDLCVVVFGQVPRNELDQTSVNTGSSIHPMCLIDTNSGPKTDRRLFALV